MNRKFFRRLALLLAVAGLIAILPAGAADLADTGRELEAYVDENYGQFPGLARRDLFYMTANGVSDLLTTRPTNKFITRNSLEYDLVYFSCLFTHSISSAPEGAMRTGLCRYDDRIDKFYPEFFMPLKNGVAMKSGYIEKEEFQEGIQYYGFVKNLLSTGTVSGNLYVVGINS